MQSIHGMATHPQEHQQESQQLDTMQQMQQQQTMVNDAIRQQQQQQQQHQNQQEAGEQQQQATMTVLESLEPAQQMGDTQVLSLMDGQHQQQQHVVQHHLVQPIGHLQQHDPHQPHLHQLQPGHLANSQAPMSGGGGGDEHELRLSSQTSNSFRPRIQIEGIAADGGGPIVQWLMENYEIAEGESLPRSTVYNHYLAHCKRLRMASVNAASFGKLIRSVFVGLKTRRLGTRGHSKYHYFGVRAKQHIRAELLRYQEGAGCSRDFNNENSSQNTDSGESDSTVNGLDACGRLSGSSSSKRIKRSNSDSRRTFCPSQEHPHQNQLEVDANGIFYSNNNGYSAPPLTSINNCANNTDKNGYVEVQALANIDQYETADLKNHLGANWATLVDEHWPQAQQQLHSSMVAFEAKYKIYYKRMVELLSELKFLDVEQLWLEFWRPADSTLMNQTHQWAGQVHQHRQQQSGTASNGAGHQQEPGSDISNQQQQQQQQHIDYQPDPQSAGPQCHPQLTLNLIYQLTNQPEVVDRIDQIDYSLYAAIESFLLPDMLSPIPRPLAQSIRMFAKNIGIWIEQSVKDYDPRFVSHKSKSARAFGYALRRYTSLNHLSTASRAIWERRSSLAQMSLDLSRVDLRDIEHQVSLMSHTNLGTVEPNLLHPGNIHDHHQPSNTADGGMNTEAGLGSEQRTDRAQQQANNNANARPQAVGQPNHIVTGHHQHQLCAMQPGQLIQNFLHLLEDPYPANSWPDWCKNLVESRVCGLSIDEARNFVLKWNFYISLIMKELTLRSAPSFGSFQLIRLLFDEYIFYLVVTRLAQAQHKTPAQLLSQ